MINTKPVMVLLFVSVVFGQNSPEQRWQITAANGDSYKNISFDRMEGEEVYLYFFPLKTRDDKSRPINAMDIISIEPYSTPLHSGKVDAINGGIMGMMLGMGIAFEYHWQMSHGPIRPDDPRTMTIAAIIGSGAALGVYAGLHSIRAIVPIQIAPLNPTVYHRYDLSNVTGQAKLERMRQIMTSFGRPWRMSSVSR